MFEMNVPEQAKVPVAHYHRDFEEVWYGLGGVLTVTLDGVAHKLKSGDALFVPRGAVHRFDNLDAGEARALITLTPAVAGKRYFEDIAAVVNRRACSILPVVTRIGALRPAVKPPFSNPWPPGMQLSCLP
jgi:uncharacterized RmlC-like cupin family protein